MSGTLHNLRLKARDTIASRLILLVAFFVPFSFANGALYVWLVVFVFSLNKTDFSGFHFFSKRNIPQLALLSLYLLGVVSLLYVENASLAIRQLTGQRLLLLLLPLTAIAGFGNYSFSDIVKAYVLGCLCFLLFVFAFFVWQFVVGMPVELLVTSHYFSGLVNEQIMHRSYISVNLIMAVIALVYLYQCGRIERKAYPLYGLFLLVVLISLLYLNSRAAIISFALLVIFYLFYFARKSVKRLFLLLFGCALIGCLFFFVPNRLLDSVKTLQEQGVEKLQEPRLEIWKNTWTVVQEQPFWGQGAASPRAVLLRQFEKNQYKEGIAEQFNAHNQYLEFLIEYGWTGLFIFLLALFSIPLVCNRAQRLFYIPFTLIFAVNLFFETMLVRNVGVVSFAFFVMLLGVKKDYAKTLIPAKWERNYLKTAITLSICALFFISYSYRDLMQHEVYFRVNPKIEKDGVVQLDNRLTAQVWQDSAYYFSSFLSIKSIENQSVMITSDVYVSEDFNGEWVRISAENNGSPIKNLGLVYYDLSRKGTWQHLELRLENINEEVKVFFYMAQYNQLNFKNLKGKVLFKNTTYTIEEKE